MKRIYATTGVLAALLLSSLTTFAQSQSRKDLLQEIEAKRKELLALEQNFLAPPEEDRARYATFLQARNTGLIRLLPREKYDSAIPRHSPNVQATLESFSRKSVTDLPQAQQSGVPTTEVPPDLRDVPRLNPDNARYNGSLLISGGGAYYSFSRKTHEIAYGSDISLYNRELSVGFTGVDYGLMAKLGDIPLETVNLEFPEAKALVSYKPVSLHSQARLEKRRLERDTEINGLTFKRRQLLQQHATYLLRSIDYDQSDVLVAFRVVRVDSDGSAIILYKLLKQFSIPRLTGN